MRYIFLIFVFNLIGLALSVHGGSLVITVAGPRQGGEPAHFDASPDFGWKRTALVPAKDEKTQGALLFENQIKFFVGIKGDVVVHYESVTDMSGMWALGAKPDSILAGRHDFYVWDFRMHAPSGTIDIESLKKICDQPGAFVSAPGRWRHLENGIAIQDDKTKNLKWLSLSQQAKLKTQLLLMIEALRPETYEQLMQRTEADAFPDKVNPEMKLFIEKVKKRISANLLGNAQDCKMQLRLMLTTPNFFELNRFHKWANRYTATEFHSRTNYFKGPDRRACAEAVNALKAKGKRLPLDLPPVRVWAPSLPLSRPFHPYR
ncbi:MAG: hypothetical protein H8E27_12705 [Verrucomicrobia subdivision 3 bacterium]|nr:hypothetical protein [Limisphaerales bacterium]